MLQGAGYGVLVGFGAVFALVTVLALWLDINFAGHHTHSESFQTAGRRIKTGLISGVCLHVPPVSNARSQCLAPCLPVLLQMQSTTPWLLKAASAPALHATYTMTLDDRIDTWHNSSGDPQHAFE